MTDPRKPKKSYYRRFQTKKRRARKNLTNYRVRRKMLTQNNNAYNDYKRRLVVRFTNSKVICQIISASIKGDHCLVYADSTELKAFGINFGLTNSSAAYLTGFLIGTRAVHALENDPSGSFKSGPVCLDIGFKRRTTGAKVFLAMKGASDAGMEIPHSPNRFFMFDDAERLRERILGKDLQDYLFMLKNNDPEKLKKQFGKMINDVNIEKIPEIYEQAIEKIKTGHHKEKRVVTEEMKQKYIESQAKFPKKQPKIPKEEKKKIIDAKLQEIHSSI